MKGLSIVFFSAFVTNLIWENLHSILYAHYQGERITELVLLRASAVDALIITALLLPFLYIEVFQKHAWIIIPAGFCIAIGIEWWALATHRWAYTADMPIIPLLHTGLTPTVQLGLLGYFSWWAQKQHIPPVHIRA